MKIRKVQVKCLPQVSSKTQASLILNKWLGGSNTDGSFGSMDTPNEINEYNTCNNWKIILLP